MDQYKPTMITAPLVGSAVLHPTSSMTNPTSPSTPAKWNRDDVSNNSDSITQQNTHYQQRTRLLNSINTPIKRIRTNPQEQDGRFAQPPQNYLAQQKQARTTTYNEMDAQQTSSAARRFATTRYPFSPFSIIFMDEVRDKTVVEDLIKHAFEKLNFELKTVAYRRGRTENNECHILVFRENTESFAFLRKESYKSELTLMDGMNQQLKIKAAWMRGGTSKGLFFHEHDLPINSTEREAIFLAAIGSPDPYGKQLNGVGGATSSTSKIVIIAPSQDTNFDVNYTFGHIAIQ
ncbi:unnamed protein product, partial [Didymodactylos carnosus]